MADSELLLQPEMLIELKRYRALERRLLTSRQQCQEFKELAEQVTPGDPTPLSTPLHDGSPATELDAALSALRQQIEIIYEIEAQLNEQARASYGSTRNAQPSLLPSQVQLLLIQQNLKIALCVVSGVMFFFLLLILLHGVMH